MKKIILLTAVMAMALLPGLQAGDEKAKDKTACCAATKPEAGKCATEGTCCGASCKATQKQAAKAKAKADKAKAKADKKAAQAQKKAAKKTS